MSREGWMKKKAFASDDNGWSERGGYMAAKVSKLEEQFRLDAPREKQKDGACSSIFGGVAIYVNGYTDPSADELRRLMMLHGGQFHVYYSRSKTTHIIASNLPNCKVQELRGEKVIRPDWITDSIAAGRLLPYLEYQLYAKQRNALFPGATRRQTSEAAGPSRGSAHPNVHHNLHPPPPCNTELSVPHNGWPSSTCRNNSVPVPGRAGTPSRTPQHHPEARLVTAQPDRPISSQLITESRHPPRSPHQTKPPHKPPLPAHPEEEEAKMNGLMPTSPDVSSPSSHASEKQRGGRAGPGPAGASAGGADPSLTNGHAHVVNGAFKPEDPPPGAGRPHPDRPRHAKPDPYEFPPSPPRTRPPPGPDPDPEGPPRPLQGPPLDQTPEFSPPSSVRLNGSLHPGPDRPPSPRGPARGPPGLQDQAGGLISEYYSHSRLHQISTWRIGFSDYVNQLHGRHTAGPSPTFPGRDRLRRSGARRPGGPAALKSCILHVDMDCFFVSVGIRRRPELKGEPVAVTSNRGPGRVPPRPGADPQLELQYYQRKRAPPRPEGEVDPLQATPSQEGPPPGPGGPDQDPAALSMAEIASCSYDARQAGVKNGMFFGRARQLCPALKSVPYDFEAYKEVALNMYEILASYTHDIEALSCDEALLDGSALLNELGVGPEDLARAIRADIQEKTGCCASVGMGSNILLARLATRKAKPDGQYHLKSEEVDDFIRDLPVTRLPGVGHVMGRKLADMGVKSCGDLQQVSLPQLQKRFGSRTGQTLFRFCRGLDDRPVRYEKERKSVSAEMNYNIRFSKVQEAESFLNNLSMEVQKRLQDAGLRGRRVTLKVMVRKVGAPLEPAKYGGHGICDSLARTVMLAQATDSGQTIAAAVLKLFHAMKLEVQDLRGLGIQVQLLEGSQPPPQDPRGPRTRSIKDMLLGPGPSARSNNRDSSDARTERTPPTAVCSPPDPTSPAEPVPGTSDEQPWCRQTPKRCRTRLNLSIEVPSPSQVDRSVLEALPAELRAQVEQSWTRRDARPGSCRSPGLQPPGPIPRPPTPPQPAVYTPPAGTLLIQIPNQPDGPGIVLELPNFSQVDPDVFAALPKELQEELKSAYSRALSVQPQVKTAEPKNPLLQLKQSGVGVGRVKRRYKRKNAVSPLKRGTSPLKRCLTSNSPAKAAAALKSQETLNAPKIENGPSTSTLDMAASVTKPPPRPAPTLAGACDLADIKTLLREWVTTITEPMEEDILQVVKYCTDLIEDKDLEKLDLIIKYMKRLMQQSLESVWSMAFDFILDNVQVVVQQTYGSVLQMT
ncbi:DNA repair protein REV1 [Cololabis saira]|uniref:DNA repair protein REV1 n=1 Tax=Cololabis saira TaxID=129043 RepID=UPI002AD215B7|nr:DNA repair protein REV1 [Cololabis saira]